MKLIVKKNFYPWQYLGVIVSLGLVTLIEYKVPFLRNEFLSSPFIVVVAVSSIYGDYLAGLGSIMVGTAAVGVVGDTSLGYHTASIGRIIAFLISGLIIFILSRISRHQEMSNLTLGQSLDQMNQACNKLKTEIRMSKRDLSRLNKVNLDLREVVDDIMGNEELWARDVKSQVLKARSDQKK